MFFFAFGCFCVVLFLMMNLSCVVFVCLEAASGWVDRCVPLTHRHSVLNRLFE